MVEPGGANFQSSRTEKDLGRARQRLVVQIAEDGDRALAAMPIEQFVHLGADGHHFGAAAVESEAATGVPSPSSWGEKRWPGKVTSSDFR